MACWLPLRTWHGCCGCCTGCCTLLTVAFQGWVQTNLLYNSVIVCSFKHARTVVSTNPHGRYDPFGVGPCSQSKIPLSEESSLIFHRNGNSALCCAPSARTSSALAFCPSHLDLQAACAWSTNSTKCHVAALRNICQQRRAATQRVAPASAPPQPRAEGRCCHGVLS